MDILYIDIYFLLNLTIDVLSVFFASKLINIKVRLPPILLIGVLGGVAAIIDCFIENILLSILNTSVFLILTAMFIKRKLSFRKRILFLIAFFISSIIFGGTISFFYDFLDKNLSGVLDGFAATGSNRSALIFSLVILISIGVLRIIVMLFSGNANGDFARIKIEIENNSIEFEALVDSGNLVKDPMSMCPVIFVKKELAHAFLPEAVVELDGVDALPLSYKKRMRLVPVTRGAETHVMVGVRVDKVLIIKNNNISDTDATIVIDKEGGDFGGYLGLAPSVILK